MPEGFEAPFWSYEDLALFIGSVIPFLGLALAAIPALHIRSQGGRALSANALAYAWFLGVLYLLISWKHRRPFWRSLFWSRPVRFPVSWIVGGLLLAIATAMLGGALGAKPVTDPIKALITGQWSLAVVMLFVVVLGPIFEELVFRGFLLPLLVNTFGPAGGIFLTALPFALLHGAQNQWAWQQMTVIGIAGAAFGYAKYKTGSTAASTLLHSGFNLVGAIAYVFQWEHGAL